MEKILTISVAAYNAEKWLERCLNSFLIPEIIDDIEIIIVNDGSSDNTSFIAKQFTSRYPNSFVLIEKENGGHGSTINASIPAANGKYYKIVDSDDWVEKEGIVDLVNKLKCIDVDAHIAPYFITNSDGSKKELVKCIDDKKNMITRKIVGIEEVPPFSAVAMHSLTFKTSLLKNNFVKIDEKCFYVDCEYIVFYMKNVNTIYISDMPVYDYLVGTNEQSVNLKNMVKRRAQHLKVFKRVLEYYDYPSKGRAILNDIIKICAINEYYVLFGIEDKYTSKKEFMEFDLFLKSQNFSIYDDIIKYGFKTRIKTAYLIKIFRILKFHGYGLAYKITRKKLSSK